MNRSWIAVIGLAGLLAGADGLAAADSTVLKIPVKSIGAAAPKEVSVEYLRTDQSVTQKVSKVPVSEGFIKLSKDPDASGIRIFAEGFDPVEVPFSNAALGISLPALSRLILKWPFRAKSGLPPSVDVYVLPQEKRPASSKVATLVPETDTFSVFVSPGNLTLMVYSPGAGVATSVALSLRPGSSERVERLEVLRSRGLSLRVMDPAGRAIPAASLRFRCENSATSSSLVLSWLSQKRWQADAKGRIELQSIPSSPCTPVLASKGFRTATLNALAERVADQATPEMVVLRPLPRLNLEIDPSILGREGSAEVSLIAEGIGASGESAVQAGAPGPKKIWSGRVRSRETIQGLEGGFYRAIARVGSRTTGVEFQVSDAADGPDEQTIRIHFESRLVRGHVFIGENPGSQVPVEALAHDRRIELDAEPIASTITGEDGSFELPISYVGSIVLRARLAEKNIIYRAIEPDPDPEKEVILRGWAGGITVRAFDAHTGDPVQDGTVELTHLLTDGHKMISSRPVPGETTLTGLGPGKLRLNVSSPRHHAQEMELTLSGDEEMPLDFMLDPKNALVVTVTGEGGEPVEGSEVLSVDPMKPVPGSTNFQTLGQTDWSGRVVLDDLPSNTVLAFLRPGYSLQFSPSASASSASQASGELSITLPALREKLSVGVAQQLAQSLSGPPTFVVQGFVVPDGLGRHLARLSGLDDQLLLHAGPESLLLWSRVLPPGEYLVFARPGQSIPSHGKETEVQARPNVAMAQLN
jgi:hypothetical protein